MTLRSHVGLVAGAVVYFASGLAGDLTLKYAMSRMPGSFELDGAGFARLLQYVFTTPSVWLGIALLATNFGLLLGVLAKADLSLVGPLRALSYLFLTLLAWSVLGESVPPLRWLGVCLITLGAGLILSTRNERSSAGEGSPEVAPRRERLTLPGGARAK